MIVVGYIWVNLTINVFALLIISVLRIRTKRQDHYVTFSFTLQISKLVIGLFWCNNINHNLLVMDKKHLFQIIPRKDFRAEENTANHWELTIV